MVQCRVNAYTYAYSYIYIEYIYLLSRLTVVSRETKKKQHARVSSGLSYHYNELFTWMADLNFENAVTQSLYWAIVFPTTTLNQVHISYTELTSLYFTNANYAIILLQCIMRLFVMLRHTTFITHYS